MKSLIMTLLLSFGLFASTNHTAKITKTLSSGGYTYMRVVDGKNSYWIAMTQRKVKVGDSISYSEQGWMKNFKSKTLNRTFDNILFAADITTTKSSKLENIKPNILTSLYKKAGTITIAELFKNRSKYAKKSIIIRGKVTKVSIGIMKRNWVHIADGSRFQNMDDIVFTSRGTTPKKGDIISATGIVTIDKDFGYGYFYPVIIEKSSFKK